ncbi:lipopolysaccharide biosynthesis protein [Streptomyces paradoxus]|nr:lipopolysaccharide biosynthesis protein [Streptomyces paradoxus]
MSGSSPLGVSTESAEDSAAVPGDVDATRSPSAAGLTSTTVRGARWTLLAAFGTFVVQIPYSAAVSRLLTPSDFGLVALAMFMLRFVSYFAQGGLSSAVVQRPVLRERDIRASCAVGITTGFAFYALFWIVAPFGVQAVHAPPELTPVCRALALSFLLSAVSATASGLLRRSMRYRTVSLIEFLSYLVGYCGFGLVSAVMGCGVWSLVYAALGQSALTALTHCALTWRHLRPLFDVRAMAGMAAFGTKVSLVGFLEFLAFSADTVLVGRYAGVQALGHYNRAWFMAALPLHQTAAALNKVLLPAFSRAQSDRDRLKGAYIDSMSVTALLFAPMAATVAVCSDNAVEVLLGDAWQATADLVPPLAVVGLLNVLAYLPAVLAEALGKVGQKAVIELLHLIVLLTAAAAAVASDTGVAGLAAALVAARILQHAAYLVWLSRAIPGSMPEVLVAYAQSTAVAVFVASTAAAAGHVMRDQPPTVALGLQLATGSAAGASVLLFGRSLRGVRAARGRALIQSAFGSRKHTAAERA